MIPIDRRNQHRSAAWHRFCGFRRCNLQSFTGRNSFRRRCDAQRMHEKRPFGGRRRAKGPFPSNPCATLPQPGRRFLSSCFEPMTSRQVDHCSRQAATSINAARLFSWDIAMRRLFCRHLSYMLLYKTLLFGSWGCMQAGLAQSRTPNGVALSGSPPVIVENPLPATRSRDDWRRDKVPATPAAQGQSSGAPAVLEPPLVEPLRAPTTTPAAVFPATGESAGLSEYWIVS